MTISTPPKPISAAIQRDLRAGSLRTSGAAVSMMSGARKTIAVACAWGRYFSAVKNVSVLASIAKARRHCIPGRALRSARTPCVRITAASTSAKCTRYLTQQNTSSGMPMDNTHFPLASSVLRVHIETINSRIPARGRVGGA